MRHIYLSFSLCFLVFSGTQVNAQVSTPDTDCSDLRPANMPCTHYCAASEKKHLGEFKCVFQREADKCEVKYLENLKDIDHACRPS